MYELNTSWVLWYHSLKDPNWTKTGYQQVFELHNLVDYKIVEGILKTNHLQNGMFFLMRKGIFPNWEDPDNTEGCCISFRIPGEGIIQEFCKIILRCITEDILQDPIEFEELNGISISPKKEFNIVKLWMRHKQSKYATILREIEPCLLEGLCQIKDNVAE